MTFEDGLGLVVAGDRLLVAAHSVRSDASVRDAPGACLHPLPQALKDSPGLLVSGGRLLEAAEVEKDAGAVSYAARNVALATEALIDGPRFIVADDGVLVVVEVK